MFCAMALTSQTDDPSETRVVYAMVAKREEKHIQHIASTFPRITIKNSYICLCVSLCVYV